MTSLVRLSLLTQMSALAAGVSFALISVSLSDAAGNTQSMSLTQTDISSPDADGKSTTVVEVSDVAEGSFGGFAQAFDSNGNSIGSAVSFSGTVPVTPPNMAPVPVSVSVTIG